MSARGLVSARAAPRRPHLTLNRRVALQGPAPTAFRARTFQVSQTLRGSRVVHFHEVLVMAVFCLSWLLPLEMRTS
jgi:hypothetical protein